jgi:hypothetical protein
MQRKGDSPMPNRTLVFTDEEDALYQEARTLANNKISPVVASLLKDWIVKTKADKEGFTTLSFFDGVEDKSAGTSKGKRVQLIGKIISKDGETYESDYHGCGYTLVYTLKKQYFLHKYIYNGPDVVCEYEVFKNYEELSGKITAKMALDVEKEIGEVEFLDI